jgi:adenosylcobinamide-GDP ribazoletransferase
MLRSILTAFRTLTILPLPGKDTRDFSRSLFFFPLVGAFLGFVVIAVFAGAAQLGFAHPQILAALSVALITWLTGCLHVDGLGDVADAFGAGKGKERILDILKDPHMGSFGVTAIVLDILIKVWCWQFFFARVEVGVVVWSLVFARSLQGLSIAFVSNARTGSIAAAFRIETAFGKALVVLSFLITGIITTFVASLPAALAYAASSLVVSALFALYCVKKIGGITGDCVGAVNELGEVSVLLSGMMIMK